MVCSPVEALKSLSQTKQHPETDAEAPLCVLHGTDSLQSIGLPDGRAATNAAVAQAAWAAEMQRVFPEPDNSRAVVPSLGDLPAEPGARVLMQPASCHAGCSCCSDAACWIMESGVEWLETARACLINQNVIETCTSQVHPSASMKRCANKLWMGRY